MFLRKKDYESLIKSDHLDTVLSQDDGLRIDRELAAQEEMSSYLRARYDVAQIFHEMTAYTPDALYQPGALVEYTEPAYDNTASYDTGQRASYQGTIYEATEDGITGAWDASKWTAIADNETLYSSTAEGTGNTPDNTDYWKPGDTRHQQILMYMIDITLYHLHARINPRNVPELRMQRRDEAIKWLKAVSDGKLQPNLPIYDTTDDEDANTIIRWDSNTKMNQSTY